jgi:hypothetical protein
VTLTDGHSTYDGRVTRPVLEADAGLAGPPAALAQGSPPLRVLPERPSNPPTTIERLRVAMPNDRVTGWMVTLIIGAIAFAIRFVNLGYPNKLIFDETYYAKDAYSLLKFGYDNAATLVATRAPHRTRCWSQQFPESDRQGCDRVAIPAVRLTSRGMNRGGNDHIAVDLQINARRQLGARQRPCWASPVQVSTAVVAA